MSPVYSTKDRMASDSGSDHNAGESQRITVDSVLEALEALKDVNGTTLTSLKKYFASNSQIHAPASELSAQLKKALMKGIRDGKIAKSGHSKFSVGIEDEDGSKKGRRRRRLTDEDDDRRPRRRRRSRRRRSRRKRSRRRTRRSRRRLSRRRRGRRIRRMGRRRRGRRRRRRI